MANEFIGEEGVWTNNGKEVTIINTYALCDSLGRRWMWEDIRSRKANSNIATWCVIGDFNCVRRSCERVGVGGEDINVGEKEEFNNYLVEMSLEDMPFMGKKIHMV